MNKKYKLVWVGGAFPIASLSAVYRLKSLRDIPRYGVKAGDVGGFVSSGSILSHDGDCWIADDAVVYGKVVVKDNAYIFGNAGITNQSKSKKKGIYPLTTICEDVKIFDEARLDGVQCVSGQAQIGGKSQLLNSRLITGNAKIGGFAKIGANCVVLGGSDISGRSQLFLNSMVVSNQIAKGEGIIDTGEKYLTKEKEISYGEKKVSRWDRSNETELLTKWFNQINHDSPSMVSQAPKKNTEGSFQGSELSVEIRDAVSLLSDIKADIEAYAADIVKVIKYPVMQDKTNSYTLEMMHVLKQAERLAKNPTHSKFVQTVMDLEKKFMAAESNALRISSSLLSEKEQKRVQKAQDLLAIAADEASSEQEKKSAFVQGFKQLEGVIVVPDSAVEAFRVKYNLREITS